MQANGTYLAETYEENPLVDPEKNLTQSPNHETTDIKWGELVDIFKPLNYGKGLNIPDRELFLSCIASFVIQCNTVESFSSLFVTPQPYGISKQLKVGWHVIYDHMLKILGAPKLKSEQERYTINSFGEMMSMKQRGITRHPPYTAAFILIFMKIIYDLHTEGTEAREFFSMFEPWCMARETASCLTDDPPKWMKTNLLKPGKVYLPSHLAKKIPAAKDFGTLDNIWKFKEEVKARKELNKMLDISLTTDNGSDYFGIEAMKKIISKRTDSKADLKKILAQIAKIYETVNNEVDVLDDKLDGDKKLYLDAIVSVNFTKWLAAIRRIYQPDTTYKAFVEDTAAQAVSNLFSSFENDHAYKNFKDGKFLDQTGLAKASSEQDQPGNISTTVVNKRKRDTNDQGKASAGAHTFLESTTRPKYDEKAKRTKIEVLANKVETKKASGETALLFDCNLDESLLL